VVMAWSELGQPPNPQQLGVIQTVWSPLINTDLVAGRIVTQMIMVGQAPSPVQVTPLNDALRG
jgi:hypothetical protein